jgi:hypothetical protein
VKIFCCVIEGIKTMASFLTLALFAVVTTTSLSFTMFTPFLSRSQSKSNGNRRLLMSVIEVSEYKRIFEGICEKMTKDSKVTGQLQELVKDFFDDYVK